MNIYQFQILNPITDRKKPHVDKHGVFIVPKINKLYRYYLECCRYNNKTLNKEYFLLLSDTKFNNHTKVCHVDDYGRLKVNVAGEIKKYIVNEIKERGNIEMNYLYSENEYDVYQIY